MRPATMLLASLLFSSIILGQNKARDWKPATVADVTYTDDEKVIPRSHMVKRQGCQGGIGCYDKVEDEPTHIPLTVAVYHFETEDTIYTVRKVFKKNCAISCGGERPLNVTIHGKTQIAVEGMKIHILDDDGKDAKLDIIEKSAKTAPAEATPK
jgi:hypothetical protein